MTAYISRDELEADLQGAVEHYRLELSRFVPDYTRPSFKNDYPLPPSWQDFKCLHPNMQPRLWTLSNGVKRVALQCQACGERQANEVRSANYPNYPNLPLFDEDLREDARNILNNYLGRMRQDRDTAMQNHDAQRRAMNEWERLAANEEWWSRYTAYLNTPQWQDRRRRVLERDNYLCQGCLKREATQVHHLTYDHMGNEPLFELVAICTVCHSALHPHMDGQK